MRPSAWMIPILLFLPHVQMAAATTWLIYPDGSGDTYSIKNAITLSEPGDTILLSDGVFLHSDNRNLRFYGKDLVLRSMNGPDSTTINAEYVGRCMIFQYGETRASRVEGITFRGGSSEGSGDGGAIICTGASPAFYHCRFTGNIAADHGGGIIAESDSDLLFVECTFDSNQARTGGGISVDDSSVELVDCSFNRNVALRDGGGLAGGTRSTILLTDCNFSGNDALEDGGGLSIDNHSTVQISTSDFIDNEAANRGGGLYIVDNSNVLLNNSRIRGNFAEYWGGGAHFDQIDLIVDSCEFIDNISNYCGGGFSFFNEFPTIQATVIAGNRAPVYGGGLYFESASPTIRKSTIAHNRAWHGGCISGYDGSSINVECSILAFSPEGEAAHCIWNTTMTMVGCNVFGNSGGDWTGCIESQLGTDGNFSDDPLFCEADSGSYALNVGSSSLDVIGCGTIGALGIGCDIVTAVEGDRPASIHAFDLLVHPNPATDLISIRYSRPVDLPATIRVFDIRGRMVRSFQLDGNRGLFEWDGRDESGERLGSGVYFIRTDDPGQTETRRVTLIR